MRNKISRAGRREGVSKAEVSPSAFVHPFLSFSRPFRDFPDFLRFPRFLSETFRIGPFPRSWPIQSTDKEYFRKGLQHNQERVGNALVWKPPGLPSLKK